MRILVNRMLVKSEGYRCKLVPKLRFLGPGSTFHFPFRILTFRDICINISSVPPAGEE